MFNQLDKIQPISIFCVLAAMSGNDNFQGEILHYLSSKLTFTFEGYVQLQCMLLLEENFPFGLAVEISLARADVFEHDCAFEKE